MKTRNRGTRALVSKGSVCQLQLEITEVINSKI